MIHDALDNPNMQIWRKCENQTTGDNLKYNFAGNTKGGQGGLDGSSLQVGHHCWLVQIIPLCLIIMHKIDKITTDVTKYKYNIHLSSVNARCA